MKKFCSIIAALAVCVLCAGVVSAAQRSANEIYKVQPHSNFHGTASTAVFTSAVKVEPYTMKTVVMQGYSSAGVTATTTLPGTLAIQCGPTISGPFVTAKGQGGNAATSTTTGVFVLEDFCPFYRLSWTKTGTDTRSISSWIIYGPTN